MQNTQYEYDYLVFIGRFQPFHNGHKTVIDTALTKSQNVIIVLGSDQESPNMRNPFSSEDRMRMIGETYPNFKDRIIFVPQVNHRYNDDRWLTSVRTSIRQATFRGGWTDKGVETDVKIGLIGHSKDHTSYYISQFPGWDHIDVPQEEVLDATDIRVEYFEEQWPVRTIESLPQGTREFLEQYRGSDAYEHIVDEVDFVKELNARWEGIPYPRTENTADAVVTQSSHILLVKRGAMPGKGQWALPGGYINANTETYLQAMLRELREETKIDVPEKVLKGNIVADHTFDDPHRSVRGRVITKAFHIHLPPMAKLPKVKGSDDAEKARWFAPEEVKAMRNQLFEDHYDIIEYFGVI